MSYEGDVEYVLNNLYHALRIPSRYIYTTLKTRESNSEFKIAKDFVMNTVEDSAKEKVHYHHCPTCYDKFPCVMDCTIEYDLQDGDKEFGAHCECFECEPIPGRDSMGRPVEEYSEKWWRIYNGFEK